MTTIKEKVINRFDELGACAIEQGYSIKLDGRIYIDLITIFLFKKIIKKELNISDKTFTEAYQYGNRS